MLAGAREAFAESGLTAQMEDVAVRAGVGIGTVYRHFPTKDAVIEAIAAEHVDALATDAGEALEEDDPWEGLAGFMRLAAARQATDRALAEVMASRPGALREEALRREDLYSAIGRLAERAQRAGDMRADLRPDDIPMIMCGLASAVQMAGPDGHEARERYLALLFDGLRAAPASR